jgi:predicted DCC family thiol-disulfide oxidoreductase YuxK
VTAIEVFFDGACPLCRREMDVVRRLDRRGRVVMTDIDAPGFVPPGSLTQSDLMARIHGRLPDGTIVEGVEVFRRIYAAVGFGPLVAVTRVAPFSWAAEAAYRVFARNRLRITGRCTDETCAVTPRTP